MQRIVDPIAVISCAGDIYTYLETLVNEKNTLAKDIENIKTVYSGVDSETIINKYLERVDKLNLIMENYNIVGNYLKEIGTAYYNNLVDSKKNLLKALGESASNTSPINSKIESSTIANEKVTNNTNTTSTSSNSTPKYTIGYVKTNGGKLNVRSDASTKSKVLGTLKNKAEIHIVEKGSKWTKIVTTDKKGNTIYGYVSSSYITTK